MFFKSENMIFFTLQFPVFIPADLFRFRELGKRVFFVTNNSTKHRREYKLKVDTLGFGGDLVSEP